MTLCIEGHDWDDVKPHLWNFFQAVKIAQAGQWRMPCSAITPRIACHMANESYFRKKPVFLGRGIAHHQKLGLRALLHDS